MFLAQFSSMNYIFLQCAYKVIGKCASLEWKTCDQPHSEYVWSQEMKVGIRGNITAQPS